MFYSPILAAQEAVSIFRRYSAQQLDKNAEVNFPAFLEWWFGNFKSHEGPAHLIGPDYEGFLLFLIVACSDEAIRKCFYGESLDKKVDPIEITSILGQYGPDVYRRLRAGRED